MKPLARNMLLAAVAIVVMVLALEFTLRATHLAGARRSWTEPDELIGWRASPGRSYWYHRENDHPITGRINQHGWRDVERTLQKPDGAYRVAVLGDSFVEAMEVEQDSTFCAIAERALTRPGAPVEVLNFGRSGMTTTEERLVLERDVFAFSPDVVVLLFVPLNDIADMLPATTVNPMRPFYRLRGDKLELDLGFADSSAFRMRRRINGPKQQSALVSLLAERYNVLRRAPRLVPHATVEKRLSGYLSLCTPQPDSVYASGYQLNKRVIVEINRLCRARGVEFMLAVAHNIYLPDEIERYRQIDGGFDPDFFEADLEAFCGREGIAFLGLQGAFRREYARNREKLTWAHYNYAGHRLVADRLAATVLRGR